MTHTYETLTEEIVKTYANIWDFKRLRKAYDNIQNQRLDTAGEIYRLEIKYVQNRWNNEMENKISHMMNEKKKILRKMNKFYKILEAEMKIRTTPIEQNTANGIYGRFC